MRIAVCDDEMVQVHNNVDVIQKWAANRQANINVDMFSSAEEFLLRWSGVQAYDLAIFDIKMRNMTGIDLAKAIRKKDKSLQIIFITAFGGYVFDGYDVAALNYLLKPYPPELFITTLDRAYDIYKQKEAGSLMISQEGRFIRIPYIEIIHMEIRGHYFDIYTFTMGNFRAKKKMDEMLAMLDKHLFIRCHRSYIVNVAHIMSLGKLEIKIKNGQVIPISLTYVQPVTQFFLDYYYRHNFSLSKGEGES